MQLLLLYLPAPAEMSLPVITQNDCKTKKEETDFFPWLDH
jgi:hypothetical protein